jgi:hypothetical protein
MTTVLKTKKATALLLHSIVQKGRHRSKPTMSKAGSAEPSTEANKEEDVDHPPNKTESYHCKLDESVRCDSDDGEDDEVHSFHS